MKDLGYQSDRLQPDQLVLPKWVKVTKNRFDKIQSIVTGAKNSKLKTSVDNKIITLNSIEELIKDIASIKLKYKETENRYNAIRGNYISRIVVLKEYTKNQNKILDIFIVLKEIFVGSKTYHDEIDDKADDEIDDARNYRYV